MDNRPLREAGRRDFHPKTGIEESIQGVNFDYYYTGRREGPSGQIELHITSVVTDWQGNVFTRKAWFMGHKETWRSTIRRFLINHLTDLGTGTLLIKRMMRDFEVSEKKYVPWENYRPVYYSLNSN